MIRFSIIALATLALASSPAYACRAPQVAKGTPYPKARTLIMAQGYIPIRTPQNTKGPECAGENRFAQCVYPEVDHCTPTGRADCNYVYRCRSTGRWIWVFTTGDAYEASDLKYVRYSGWMRVNPHDLHTSFLKEVIVVD